MSGDIPVLPLGYSLVPAGKVATLVTCLEMRAPPPVRPAKTAPAFTLKRWEKPALDAYRALFRRIGEQWMWISRLVMDDADLRAILDSDAVEFYLLMDGEREAGLLELDFREHGQCELAFFGLVEEAIGHGAGRFLMEQAISRAWEKPISRFWVHTCHLDHPAALDFYRRSGFTPYALMIEVMDDPRLTGLSPREISPHVAIIEP